MPHQIHHPLVSTQCFESNCPPCSLGKRRNASPPDLSRLQEVSCCFKFEENICSTACLESPIVCQEYIWRPGVFISLMQSFCGMVMAVWTIGYWWPLQHIVTNSSSRSHYPWIINQRDSWQSEDQKAMMTTIILIHTFDESPLQNTNVQVIDASSCIHLSHVVLEMITAQNSQRLLLCRLPIENRCGSAKLLLQSLAGWAFMGNIPLGSSLRWWTCCVTPISSKPILEVLVTMKKNTGQRNLGLNYKFSKQSGFDRIRFLLCFIAMSEHTSHFKNVG